MLQLIQEVAGPMAVWRASSRFRAPAQKWKARAGLDRETSENCQLTRLVMHVVTTRMYLQQNTAVPASHEQHILYRYN